MPDRFSRWLGLLGAVLSASMLLALPARATATELLQLTQGMSGKAGTLRLQLSAPVVARTQLRIAARELVIDLPAKRSAQLRVPAVQAPLRSLQLLPQKNGSLRLVVSWLPGTLLNLQPANGQRSSQFSIALKAGGTAPRTDAAAVARVPNPVAAAHAPAEVGRDIVVAVDAGHGGEDPGASGKAGTQEKDITLAIARRLAERLRREPGMRAVLTRDNDRFVPLRERAERARQAGADLFVSVHADSVLNRDIEGASVYVLSDRGASSEAARLLADRENAAALRGVPLSGRPEALASVLMNLSQSAALGSSVEAATNVLSALDDVGAIRKRVVQYAGFAVLKSPDMPSMLVETAYISNPAEEGKLRDAAYQGRLAEAISSGVIKYFRIHPPDGTRLAPVRVAQR